MIGYGVTKNDFICYDIIRNIISVVFIILYNTCYKFIYYTYRVLVITMLSLIENGHLKVKVPSSVGTVDLVKSMLR